MSKKKTAKAKTTRGVRDLRAKTLTAKDARNVKGGKAKPVLMQACATGEHFKKVTITM